jgi:hypothetical protein
LSPILETFPNDGACRLAASNAKTRNASLHAKPSASWPRRLLIRRWSPRPCPKRADSIILDWAISHDGALYIDCFDVDGARPAFFFLSHGLGLQLSILVFRRNGGHRVCYCTTQRVASATILEAPRRAEAAHSNHRNPRPRPVHTRSRPHGAQGLSSLAARPDPRFSTLASANPLATIARRPRPSQAAFLQCRLPRVKWVWRGRL